MTCLQRGLIAMKQEKSKLSKKRFLLLFCLFIISFSLICIWGSSSVFAVTFEQAKNAGKRLSAGLNHSLMIKIDDTVVAWGDDTYGQGAEGTANVGLSGVKMISAGYYHNLALKSDGTVVAWGLNTNGQCSGIPTGLIGVSEIAAGGYHSLALKDGEVLAWGNNANGQCTVPLEAQSGVIAIAAGGYHSLALKEDGTVVAWGLNTNGQCSGIPADLTDVIAIAAGDAHSLALKADGTVVAWGANEAWQCEIPDGLKDVVTIAAGGKFSLVLTSGGTVETWGEDIGHPSLYDCGIIVAGDSHAIAVTRFGGNFVTWGNNDYGQRSIPSGLYLTGGMENIIISEGELSPVFSSNLRSYNVKVPNSVESIDITYFAQTSNQTFGQGVISGIPKHYSLTVGLNRPYVQLFLSGTNICREYVLLIERAAATTDLKELKINIARCNPVFNSATTLYTVDVDKNVESINITAIPNDPEAIVTATIGEDTYALDAVPLLYGENHVNITVAKGEETKTYTLNIKKAGFLENLSVSEGEFTTAFDPEIFGYTVSVNSNVTSLGITPTLRDSTHQLLIDGVSHNSGIEKTIDLSGGGFYTIKLEVKEPVTGISRTYTVNINRVTKNDFVGSGTIEDPYLIYNIQALQEIAYDTDFLDNKYFRLACDLDATNMDNWNNGAGFMPIGNSMNKFTGYFDGAGHTITGLYINQSDMDNVGLFGYTDGGEIKNLGLAKCNISGGNNVGALVGNNNSTYLEKCFSTGTVSGTSAVGGLVGQGAGPSSGTRYYLDCCYSRASVNGEGSASGGLIGQLASGGLKNCYASGFVEGSSDSGGLVGYLTFYDYLSTYCYWDINTSGQITSALGDGKSTVDMKEQTTYSSWDFIGTWTIDSGINGGYPYLCAFKDVLLSPVVDNSLVLWLEGEHGSNDAKTNVWKDLSGKGNHGTLNNFNFTRDNGWTGKSLNFDGTDDGVLCPSINIGDGDFTMEVFTSSDEFKYSKALLTKNSSGDAIYARKGFGLGNNSGGILSLSFFVINEVKDNCGFRPTLNKTYPLSHILVIRKGNMIYSYWNYNEIKGSSSIPSNFGSFNNNEKIRISESYKSNIVSCRIYDRALTDAEVQQNYQAEVQRQNALEKANLAELIVTPGVISPAFKASTLNYTVLLEDRAVESVNITATPLGADATVMIDGQGSGIGTQSSDIDVSSGTKEVPIVVTEADGITTKTYKIRIVKPGYLTGLFIDGTSVTGFASETLDYTVDVANSVAAVNIAAILEDPSTQGLMINNQPCTSGNTMQIPLNVGMNTIPIKVTVPGSVTTYTLNIKRTATADLQALTINRGTLAPSFDPATTSYTVALNEPLDNIEITCTPVDLGATVTINGEGGGAGVQSATVSLTPGTNTINVVVASVDKLFEKTYTVNVIRPAYLTELTVKNNEGQPFALAPAFTSTTFDYTLSAVENNVTFLDITAIGENAASVLINDITPTENTVRISLEVGPNPIIIKAAPNTKPDIINIYTITIHRKSSANLSNLLTSAGTLLPSFNADTTDYTITLDNPLDSIDLTATPSDSKASVTMLQPVIDDSPVQSGTRTVNVPLKAGKNPVALMVQGTDGITTKTYNVEVTRPAVLTDLTINKGTLTPDFDATTQTYTATVDDRTTSLNITASVEEGAELYINGDLQTSGEEKEIALKVGTNEITINTVIAGLTRTYTLTVTRTASDVSLSGLSTNIGEWNDAFTPDTIAYTVTLDTLVEAIEITATPADSGAMVKINGNGTEAGEQKATVVIIAGENIIPINITGWDGVTTGAYTLTVVRPGCLTDLTVSDGTGNKQELLPVFASETLSYTVNVPNNITEVDIKATLENEVSQQLSINGEIVASGTPKTIALAIGPNPLTIEVITTGITRTYLLTVNRAMSESVNTNLWQLSTDVGEIIPLFNPANTAYTMSVAYTIDNLTITAVPFDSDATVLIKGEGTGAGAQSVTVPLDAGDNLIPIIVRARDESTTKTYTLKVIRGLSSNANLQALTVDKGTLTPNFDHDTATYKVESRVEINTLGITATTTDPSATFTINEKETPNNVPLTVNLDHGGNLIPIVVTASDEITQKAYIISVNGKVSNANLGSLTVKAVNASDSENPQVLNLDFNSAKTYYQLSVDRTITSLELTASPADSKALILLNKNILPTGKACQIALAEGENIIQLMVVAQDASTKIYTLEVFQNRFLGIATNSLPIGILGTPYTCKLTANGGSTPYTWSATGLPTGFTLNPSTGEITGTPKSEGVYEIAITVTDKQGNQVTKSLTLRLNLGCGTSGYLLTPIKDPVYTIGNSQEGFPLLTINKGYSGFYFFSVNITPVKEHLGNENLLFTHLRKGRPIQTSSIMADYDQLSNAQAGFNVCPGDVIKIQMAND